MTTRRDGVVSIDGVRVNNRPTVSTAATNFRVTSGSIRPADSTRRTTASQDLTASTKVSTSNTKLSRRTNTDTFSAFSSNLEVTVSTSVYNLSFGVTFGNFIRTNTC